MPAELAEAFTRRFGMPVLPVYGMTECAGLVTATNIRTEPVPGTVGWAPPGVEIHARQSLPDGGAGDRVGPGESGVLVVRGPNVFPGYAGNKPNPFTEDGWLITGDLGSVAADSLVRITGRAKDLIIRSGHNIDPAVIEDAAVRHPQVVTSAAVARPDAYAGEIPTLYVVLRDASPEVMDDLHAHMTRSVPEPPARPKPIVRLPALPMTAAGKIDKTALRLDAAARVAKESFDSSPAFKAINSGVTAEAGLGGRIVVTVTLTGTCKSGKDLATAASRLLSGFPFDHKIAVRSDNHDEV